MILTSQLLHAVGTSGCGFNSAQLAVLGVTNKKSGWLRGLVGREISEKNYALLLELKGAKPSKQRTIVPKLEMERIANIQKPQGLNRRECKRQIRRFWNCVDANEFTAAEDHINRIAELCREAQAAFARKCEVS